MRKYRQYLAQGLPAHTRQKSVTSPLLHIKTLQVFEDKYPDEKILTMSFIIA